MKYAKQCHEQQIPLVLDEESVPLDIRRYTKQEVDGGIIKFCHWVDLVHDNYPDVKVGWYAMVPMRDYWTPYQYLYTLETLATNPNQPWYQGNLPKFKANYEAWQACNAYLRPIADKVDYIFPSLYTFYEDRHGWEIYAKANMAEARKYGKPVYPFIWMKYHDSSKLAGQDVPADYWRMQLDIIKANADGIVIWGGWLEPWNENAGWWRVTQDFLHGVASTYNSESSASSRSSRSSHSECSDSSGSSDSTADSDSSGSSDSSCNKSSSDNTIRISTWTKYQSPLTQ